MIDKVFAEKFIEQITQYTDYNINIMDDKGIIIASRDPKRVGTFHEVAYHIIKSKTEIVETAQNGDYLGVFAGINMAITVNNHSEGVVGVTGDPAEIKPIALVIKMAIEAMLKYEKQHQEQMYHKNLKAQFMYMLINDEGSNLAELRTMADRLNYSESYSRVSILLKFRDMDAEELLNIIKTNKNHTKEDISFVIGTSEILIFKAISLKTKYMFKDYKYQVLNYLGTILQWIEREEKHCDIYVGSLQNTFNRYYYSYRHCKWLEENIVIESGINFFYDHIGAYMINVTPMNELQMMFQTCGKGFDESFIENYKEVIGVLIRTNYNFTVAAKELFIHKNTLTYRYNKIKDTLSLNPISSAKDRQLTEALYAYLEKLYPTY